jgi:hypothetical protein
VWPRRRAIGASSAQTARCTGQGGLTILISSANCGPSTAKRSSDGLPCSSSSPAAVDVQRLGDAGRRVGRLDPQQLAVRLGGREQEAHALPGAGVEDLECRCGHRRSDR